MLDLIVNRRIWQGSAADITANADFIFEAGNEIYQTGDFTRVKLADGVNILARLPWSETAQKNHTASAVNATATITADELKTGYITSTSAAPVTATLPTATALLAVLAGAAAGTWFDFAVDNSAGASVVTVAASASIAVYAVPVITGGSTLTVAAGVVALFRIYFTSATVAKIYRIG